MIGTVQSGKQEARTLGCPTINIFVKNHNVSPGIYVGSCGPEDRKGPYKKVLIYSSKDLLEVHVLEDFNKDDEIPSVLDVLVTKKIRDPLDFSKLQMSEIKDVIANDIANAIALIPD